MLRKFFLAIAVLTYTNIGALAAGTPDSFAPLVEKLSPAVVNISTTQTVKQTPMMPPQFKFSFPPGSPFEDFFENQRPRGKALERKATSLGSGFIIDSKGIIVTNNHVVSEAEEITVTLHDDTQLEAEIIGRDEKIDIAVLKVKTSEKLPFVKFGDSDEMRVGDWIIAIGNPYGLGGSVSAGIISARARDINVGPFDDFLQTDAAINRGNSGGPMFNLKGEVVGVNTAIFSPSGGNVGIGFALPAELAEPVIKQILKFGKAKRAWLGVKIQEVSDEIAESLGMEKAKGALVLEVIPGSPSEDARIQEGDVIIKFNGQGIEEMRNLPRIVAESPIGERVIVQVFRNGQVKNLRITLGEMKDEEIAEKPTIKKAPVAGSYSGKTMNIAGITITAINSRIRDRFGIEETSGLLILDVNENSNAFERGFRPKQVITKVNQSSVSSFEDFEKALKDAKKLGRDSVLLLVNSGNNSRFIALPIN